MRHDLIAVIDSQDVAVAQVQAGGRGREKRRGLVIYFVGEAYSEAGARLGTGGEVRGRQRPQM